MRPTKTAHRARTTKAMIPSRFSAIAPNQPDLDSSWDWQLFYYAHHFLFRSIYPPIIAFYLICGIVVWMGRPRQALAAQMDPRVSEGIQRSATFGSRRKGADYFLREEERPQHLLVVGASGYGKTQALISLVAADIANGRGVVFIDLKGDRQLAHKFHELSHRYSRQNDFHFFSFEPGASDSYNPLAEGDALSKKDRTFTAGTFGSEEYYKQVAGEALERVLSAMHRRGGALTLQISATRSSSKMVTGWSSNWAEPEDRPQFERDLDHWEDFQRSVSGLRANLKTFSSDSLRDRLCQPAATINLHNAHARNQIVYFELNAQMRPIAAAALARMVLEDLKGLAGSLSSYPQRRKPFRVYVDEAGRAVYRGIAELISLCRSAEISLTLSTQSPRDFDTSEFKVMTQVLQNTATKIIFRQPDPESASLCAELGGTRSTMQTHIPDGRSGIALGNPILWRLFRSQRARVLRPSKRSQKSPSRSRVHHSTKRRARNRTNALSARSNLAPLCAVQRT